MKPKTPIAGNRFRTTFGKTFPMSTYLAAWAVLPEDYGYETAFTQQRVPIRVFARKNAVRDGLISFATNVTAQSVDFFQNEYFDSNLQAIPPKIG